MGNAVFPPEFAGNRDVKERWQFVLDIEDHLWSRFNKEVVPLLGPRKTWSAEKETLEVDDVVIEIDENTPRGQWRKLRVCKVLPSEDGLIRRVEVINAGGKKYERAVAKLIPIVRN